MPAPIRAVLPCLVALFTVTFTVLSPARARDDARIRAEVEATLASISRSVLAADQKAYLAHIDPTEPHFLAEHTHWSDELAKYKPAEFALAIGEGPVKFEESAAEVPLVMTWKFVDGPKDNWGTDPKGRSVKFPTVRFAKKDGKWVYRGEKWKEIAAGSPDGPFTVRFLDGSEAVAEDVIKAFPVAKAHVDTEFQRLIKTPQTLVIYKSMDHLKATVYLNMPDSYLGGWSEAGESIKFMDSYTRGVPGWTAAYAHEYAHVATWELGPGSRKMPWWVQEGVAELCAGKFRPGYAQRLNGDMTRKAKAGTLADWSKISDYLTTAPPLKMLAYTQGDHLLSFITSRHSREARNTWLAAMASGKSLDEATRSALGMGFDELDGKWRQALEQAPAPEAKAAAAQSDSEPAEGNPPAKPSAPEPAGLRASLQQLLKDMTAAVAAGDQAKYLSFVDKADPVFAKEQENWAKDFTHGIPEFIEIALDDPPLGVGDDGAAVGRITMNWRMPKGRDRTISFPARFAKTDKGWLYAGEKWNVHRGEHCLVLYESEDLKAVAESVAGVLPEVRAPIAEAFGLGQNESVTKAVQQVKLYTSMRHLQHSIYLSYTDGLSGWNEPGESIKILASTGTRKGMLRVLLGHEYGHVATFHLGSKASDMPWWILEGIAELSSEPWARSATRVDRMVKGWAKTDKIIAWEKLADFRGEAANHGLNVYNQGHHMVAYIAKAHTRPKLNDWMRDMAQGQKLDEATKKVLGISFEELDAKWRETLKEADKPPEAKPEAKPEEAKPEAPKAEDKIQVGSPR